MGNAEIVSGKTVNAFMNAPLNVNSTEKRLLLAAIDELKGLYSLNEEPCRALLISRNYHLLSQQAADIDLRLVWKKKAVHWRQQYAKQRGSKYVDVDFFVQTDLVLSSLP